MTLYSAAFRQIRFLVDSQSFLRSARPSTINTPLSIYRNFNLNIKVMNFKKIQIQFAPSAAIVISKTLCVFAVSKMACQAAVRRRQ